MPSREWSGRGTEPSLSRRSARGPGRFPVSRAGGGARELVRRCSGRPYLHRRSRAPCRLLEGLLPREDRSADTLAGRASDQDRPAPPAICTNAPWGNGPVRLYLGKPATPTIEDVPGTVLVVASALQPRDDWSPIVRLDLVRALSRLLPRACLAAGTPRRGAASVLLRHAVSVDAHHLGEEAVHICLSGMDRHRRCSPLSLREALPGGDRRNQ
jgi:hypothetical protein